MSTLKSEDLESIDALNKKFGKWLLNDYQNRPHSGLSGETPLNFFLKEAEQVELITDLAAFNKKLLITVKRTVKKDATISLGGKLYETEMFLAGEKLDVKYDPDLADGIKELFLYKDDAPVGVARIVNFIDNGKRKRIGSDKTDRKPQELRHENKNQEDPAQNQKANTISYLDVMQR